MYTTPKYQYIEAFTDKEITDTNDYDSSEFDVLEYNSKTIFVDNGFDENVDIQPIAIIGDTEVDIGTAETVNSESKALIGSSEIAQLAYKYPKMKIRATCGTGPSSGTLDVSLFLSGV